MFYAPSADFLTPGAPGGSNNEMGHVCLRPRAYDLALRLRPHVKKSKNWPFWRIFFLIATEDCI